ncbi:unnamed protein product [Blepharisma stoltei]|uniref:Globin family profile domain-containing protein n=1 Tax=Blepharisma stoltei TaxID=1481888 RepID=A0AAU9IY41_9CILI|nr:unnamed protein product [Blepharisma stoltei]
MDISATLENLNHFHQKAIEHDEILHFREDVISLIKASSQKGLFKGVYNQSDFIQNLRPQKLNSILPKISQQRKLNLYELFVKHADVASIKVNIPTTLLRTGETSMTFLVHTLKNGNVISRPCQQSEFFKIKADNSGAKTPLYCFKKINKKAIPLYSKESAENMWNLTKDPAILQLYIRRTAKMRVKWNSDTKLEYIPITKSSQIIDQITEEPIASPSKPFKKRLQTITDISELKYTKAMLQKSKTLSKARLKSVTKPLLPQIERSNKPRSRSQIVRRSPSYKEKEETSFDQSLTSDGTLNTPVRKLTSSDAKIDDEEKNQKIMEIESMVSQTVNFFNTAVFRGHELKEMTFDFILDKSKNWVLIKCREYSLNCQINLSYINTPNDKHRRRRSQSNSAIKALKESTPILSKKNSMPKMKTKLNESDEDVETSVISMPRHRLILSNEINEKDVFEKYTKASENIDHIIKRQATKLGEHKPPAASFSNPLISKFQCPFKNHDHVEHVKVHKNKNWNEKICTLTQSHLNDAINSLDELKVNSLHTQQSLVQKYGGNDFWNQFILSLYNKILSNEILHKYFISMKLENFKMIVNGMFIIFNGEVSPEFRRRVRMAHHRLGLAEAEFNCYADIFKSTLNEQQVEESDKKTIMSQVKSMKCLICR